jgi:hypothetical protein
MFLTGVSLLFVDDFTGISLSMKEKTGVGQGHQGLTFGTILFIIIKELRIEEFRDSRIPPSSMKVHE